MTKPKAKPAPVETPVEPERLEPLRVFYIGNFEPEHSTENHVARALENNGHDVWIFQENDREGAYSSVAEQLDASPAFILWTRTGWDWDRLRPDVGAAGTNAEARRMLRLAGVAGVPVVGYHLDIWWGLQRERQIQTEPFFEVDLLVTADGGHDDRWVEEGIRHAWLPPGVSLAETEPGTASDELRSPIAFVGSHDGGYHPEHQHRRELVRWLRQSYRRDCAFWPQPGQAAVRGQALRDLYASVDVIVGDSCFAGSGLRNYWSDRIPETVGRGGLLVHPNVPGLDQHFFPATHDDPDSWEHGHLLTWNAYDWDALDETISWALSEPEAARRIAERGRAHVREHHSYERRMEQLVDLLYSEHLLA